MLRKIKTYLSALTITSLYWLLSRTWRIRHFSRPILRKGDPKPLYAHWHGDELLLVGALSYTGMAVMTSRSKDGEMMTLILKWLGYRPVRGSSSRGGVGGLKGLIDLVKKQGRDASLAVDGPRGPLHKVKPGILKLAQETGRPIIAGAASARRSYLFEKAWNHCYLPFPFTRCAIFYSDPISVPRDCSDLEFESYRLKLEQQLTALKQKAQSRFTQDYAGVMEQINA